MLLLDEPEYGRWRRTAESSLEMAELAADNGLYHHACLHAEQAAQQAIKGLLHAAGATATARGHDLAMLGAAAESSFGGWSTEDLGRALARLSRHYLPSRYPDALPGGTPADHYRADDAAEALADARLVRDAVGRSWSALLNAAVEDRDEGR